MNRINHSNIQYERMTIDEQLGALVYGPQSTEQWTGIHNLFLLEIGRRRGGNPHGTDNQRWSQWRESEIC